MSKLSILLNGIIKENPSLVLLLGLCPSLATTTSALNALGMGAAATVVLIGSNVVISMLRKIIPDKVRIPAYIVVIATFVSIVQMFLQALVPDIYKSLGIFLPLIVVNCIILGRAEMFASKNSVVNSLLDGIGMGLGFTLALVVIGTIREILGSGTLFGIAVLGEITPTAIFALAPGGFFVFGCVVALINVLTKGKAPSRKNLGCASCPSAQICGAKPEEANS